MRLQRDRFRVRLRDEAAAGAVPLELPQRRIWPAGLITGAMFVMFAGVAWTVVGTLTRHPVRDVFDLMTFLFQGFWLLGWSVGVFFLGAITVLLFFYGESARLQEGRLLYVPRLGPFKIIIDYDLARIRNMSVQRVGGSDKAQIRFDYDEDTNATLGDSMPRADAERILDLIKLAAGGALGSTMPAETLSVAPLKKATRTLPAPMPDEPAVAPTMVSGLVLIGANLVPLAGVLVFGWDLPTVMVLFWAESAVIGVFTAIKMAITGKVWAIVGVPFFIGHFGGFMAMHFLLIYSLFIRGVRAAGPEPDARQALLKIFVPLWIPLAALFVSHGVSFVTNFIGRREFERTSMQALMAAPYSRIMAMQLALIFGGWVVLLLKNPVPALALLVVVKTAVDLNAHRKEHLAS